MWLIVGVDLLSVTFVDEEEEEEEKEEDSRIRLFELSSSVLLSMVSSRG